jgi:hypothetical protein
MEGKLTQLDNVANNSHDQEAHADGLGNAQEFALVGCERGDMLAELYVFVSGHNVCMRACWREEEEHVRLVCDLPRVQEAQCPTSGDPLLVSFFLFRFARREVVKTYACCT